MKRLEIKDKDIHNMSITEIKNYILLKLKEAGFDLDGNISYSIAEPLTYIYTQKEKDDGCEYCNNATPLTNGATDNSGICIRYPNRLIAYGYSKYGLNAHGVSAKIKYCPMCGCKLNIKEA